MLALTQCPPSTTLAKHQTSIASTDITSLKVPYHPLYSMNKFVTNGAQDGAQVFPYMG